MKPGGSKQILALVLFIGNLFLSGEISAAEKIEASSEKRPLTVEDLKGATRTAVETCLNDLETYCQNVTPGEEKYLPACILMQIKSQSHVSRH